MASLALSALLTAGLTAPAARAGSYTDVQSGDKTPATVTPAADATPAPPAPLGPYDAVATSAVTPYSPDGDPTYTIKVNPGTITDTFTWTHDNAQQDNTTDPPPTCVLVEQNSSATWFVRMENGTGTGDGQADPGLPKGTVTTGTYGQPDYPSLSLSAVLYSVKTSPGASFPVSCSPTASFTGTTGANGSVSGEATVSGGASVYPVTVTLDGVKVDTDGSLKLLTGQQVEASINLNGGPGNLSNFEWTVEGDGVYGAYLPSESAAQIQPIDTTESSVFFYDKTGGDKINVSCTATITFPDGTTSSVSATAPMINVLKPTVTQCSINGIEGINYRYNNFGTGDSPVYRVTEIWAPIVITVPDPFSSVNGSACIAQIIRGTTFQDTRATSGEPAYVPQMEIDPYGTYDTWVSVSGGLDCGYPYPFTDTYSTDSNGNGSVMPSNATSWGAPGTGAAEDNPQVPCAPSLVAGDTGTTDWNASSGQDDFYTWIMYSPDGSSWVPLSKISWTFFGNASLSGGTWHGGGSASSSDATATDEFPEWSSIVPYAGTGHLRYGPAQQ